MEIINLGIVAHVDAGKTTLTERILLATGAIRRAGSVDSGDTHTDTLEVERRRGISVKSASVQTVWNDVSINIIDTPGHTDFSSEVGRALVAFECAVLVVSAAEGVQSQTEVIFKALKSLNIPTVFFINKTDRAGTDAPRTVRAAEAAFGIKLDDYRDGESLLESVCERDDSALERYVENEPGFGGGEIVGLYKNFFHKRLVFPYLAGSAIRDEGVTELLDLITGICPRFRERRDGKLCGVVYKIEHDKTLGRLAHVKLNGGELKNRDAVFNPRLGLDEKIVQIRKITGVKASDAGVLRAGEIGILCGLANARVYDLIGDPALAPPALSSGTDLIAPLLRAKIAPTDGRDYPALVAAASELTAEDPLLGMSWFPETRELVFNITGLIQMEILQEVLKSRFSLDVEAGQPTVIYKETATVIAEGYDEYTMPKPCWAVLKFLIEPAGRGSGVTYKSIVNVDKIAKAYQAQVAQALPDALRQGPLGWEVTDVKITLIDGEDHVMHTHPLDFIVATPMALMRGLVNAKTALLEPLYRFRLSVPEENGGKVMNEIILMRGAYDGAYSENGRTFVEGRYPVAEGLSFPVRLASMTNGRGTLSLDFGGYELCPEGLGKTTPYRGINPLDRAKYILAARHAL